MECFDGTKWWEISVSSPDLNGGTRGIFGGGYGTAPHQYMNRIDYITIETAGNSVDFGDMSTARSAKSGGANRTRGLFVGGRFSPTSDGYNIIDYITISSTGNAQDFGDLTIARNHMSAATNGHGGL